MLGNKRGYHPHTLSVLATFAGIAIASSVAASEVNYSHLKIHYLKADTSTDELEDATGFNIGGSFQNDPSFYVFGDLKQLSADADINDENRTADGGIEGKSIEIGVGYIRPISEQWDINLSGSFIRIKGKAYLEMNFLDRKYYLSETTSDTGFGLKGGFRGMINPGLEARAFINLDNVGDSDTYASLGINAFLTENVSLGGDIEFGDTEISAGLKIYF